MTAQRTTRRIVLATLAIAVGALLALVGAPDQRPAAASAQHRAAVVVDLGDGHVKVGCVSFTEDHISGLEALDRASMAPVAQTYGGQGSAVCAICGKGCAAGSTCLTCRAPNYWAYFHHGTYSPVGAGQTEVRDGDTESWKWGKGEAPTRVPFDQVCSAAGPPPTPAPTSSSPATTTGSSAPPASSPVTVPRGGTGPAPSPPSSANLGGSSRPSATSTVPSATSSVPSATSSVPTSRGGPGPSTSVGVLPGSSTSLGPTIIGPAPASSTTVPPATGTSRPQARRSRGKGRSQAVHGSGSGSRSQQREVAVERVGSGARPAAGESGGDDGAIWSATGFAIVMAVIGAGAVLLRRRRPASRR